MQLARPVQLALMEPTELTEQLVLPVRMDLMELLELLEPLEPLGLLDLRGLQDRPETRGLKV